MSIYRLRKEQFIPTDIETVWMFFATPENLKKIMPGDTQFEFLTELHGERVYRGMKIEYKIRPILNISLLWVTEIKEVMNRYRFTDVQIKGPFSLWEHTHTFTSVDGGVRMADDLRYALPLGPLGNMVNALYIRKRLHNLFDDREKAVKQYFTELNKQAYVAD